MQLFRHKTQHAIKRLMVFAVFALMNITLIRGAESARDILNKTLTALDATPAIEAEYAVTSSDGSIINGIIILSGNKFTIKADGMATWYDGKTQWTYSESTAEVNITEPTDDEIAELNPLVILRSDSDVYNLKLKKRTKEGNYQLELIDRTDGDMNIARAVIVLNPSTYLPISASVEVSSGERYKLIFKNLKKLNSISENTFRFNPKDYKGVEIIDLR